MTALTFAQHSFVDSDDFANCFARQGWAMELNQLDRGSFCGEVGVMTAGPFRISHIRVNRRLQIRAQMPEDHLSLGIPVEMPAQGSWMRRPLTQNMLQRYGQGVEFEAVTPPGFETLMVAISSAYAEHGLNDGGRFLEVENSNLSCPESLRRKIGRQLLDVIRNIQLSLPDGKGHFTANDTAETIAGILGGVLGRNASMESPKGWIRERVLKKAEELIRESEGEPISVNDLLRHCHTSKSTLERSFVDAYGINPKSYLAALRLNGVRKDLNASDPEIGKVVDSANRWGFWHMGQFAKDYRRYFDELPSETLQRPSTKRFLSGK